VLGASGIGLRAMKNWGRKLALCYAVYGIFAAITGMVMMVKYLMPALSKLHDPAAQGGMMGGVMGGLIGIAYPVVILVFMSKQNVREAFERANEPPVPPAHVR
jgi:H+/Cl- antiporter ClcA